MKFGQVIQNITKKICQFKNHVEDNAGILVEDLLFLEKAIYEVKANSLQLCFDIF